MSSPDQVPDLDLDILGDRARELSTECGAGIPGRAEQGVLAQLHRALWDLHTH